MFAVLRPDILFLQTEHLPEILSDTSGTESIWAWLKINIAKTVTFYQGILSSVEETESSSISNSSKDDDLTSMFDMTNLNNYNDYINNLIQNYNFEE